jgi:hypothetical protein
MSFLSDLVEGNFGNLGNDITHAPSSLANHPGEIAEVGAAALAALTLGATLPESIGAIGATEAGLGAADLGAADAAFGAFDSGLFAANTADAALGLGGVDLAGLGGGVADLGAADAAFGAFDPGVFGENVADVAGGFGNADLAASAFDIPGSASFTSSPATFAETDAELSGGLTGTAPTASTPSYVIPGVANAPAGADVGLADANASFGTFDAGVASGGGGLTSQLSSVLSSPWTKLAMGAAPLGLALMRGEAQLPSGAQQAQANAAALSSFGQQQLAMGQAGQLNAGQMALITKTKDDLTNAARQAMFNMGVQNPQADSRWPQMLANIDTQVTAMTAQMIQQEIQNGLTALGSASGTLNQIAEMQMRADQNFTNTLVNATKALGLAAATSGTRTTTTTTQAAA